MRFSTLSQEDNNCVLENTDLLTDKTSQPRETEAHLTEGVAAPQSILVAVVLGHTDVPGALFEVEGRLHDVPVVLHGQLSSAGGDGNCEGVDDESLALPQVHLCTVGSLQALHMHQHSTSAVDKHNTQSTYAARGSCCAGWGLT